MRLLPSFLLPLALVASAHADSIHLRTSARLTDDSGIVRLADVARLEGPRATALGDVVVATLDGTDRVQELSVASVRARLDAAGVHWGIVNLSGRAVTLRPPSRNGAAAPTAMSGLSLAPMVEQAPSEPDVYVAEAADVVNQATRLGVVTRLALEALARPAADLRLTFKAEDRPLLEEPVVPADVDVTFLSSLNGDRVNIALRLWQDGALSETTRITCQPQLRTVTAVARHAISRGSAVGVSDVEPKVEWLRPTLASAMADPATLGGFLATSSIKAGETIRRGHLKSPAVVDRGDRVVVRCRVMGGVITLQAEALDDGAVGESIELRKLGERVTVMARVTGPGEAFVDLAR